MLVTVIVPELATTVTLPVAAVSVLRTRIPTLPAVTAVSDVPPDTETLPDCVTDIVAVVAVVLGFGVNLAAHPTDTPYPATDCATAGVPAGRAALFTALAGSPSLSPLGKSQASDVSFYANAWSLLRWAVDQFDHR